MTPELKTACEVIFQEHKISAQPIKWSSETFRGRISLGLSDLAKDTLVKKKIIILPDKSKKIITLLNPAVADAASFEEAEDIIINKKQVLIAEKPENKPTYIAHQVSGLNVTSSGYSHKLLPISDTSETQAGEIKWYLKPLFYYAVWPFCAAVAGAFVTFLLNFAYTKLFWTS